MSAERTISLDACPEEIRQRIEKRVQKGDKVLFVRDLGGVIYNAYVSRPYLRYIISAYTDNGITDITPLGADVGFIAAILEHDEEIAVEIKKRLDQKSKRPKNDN